MRISSSCSIYTLGIILATALVPGAANAHDRWPVAGDFYVDLGGGIEWVNLPDITAFNVNAAGEEFGSIDDEFDVWSAEFALGFVDREGLTLPDPIGQNARVELRGRYSSGQSDAHERAFNAIALLMPSDPATGVQFGVFGADILWNTSIDTWDAELTYQTDVVVTDRLAFSPLIGLAYMHLALDNDFKGVAPGFGPFVAELNDKTRFNYYGLALGADVTLRPASALEIVLGLRTDLMWASGDMDANYDDPFGRSSEKTDADSHFATRSTASLGLGVLLGSVRLGIDGFVRYLSYLPVPDHPTFVADRNSNIDSSAMWSAGVKGSLTIWFP